MPWGSQKRTLPGGSRDHKGIDVFPGVLIYSLITASNGNGDVQFQCISRGFELSLPSLLLVGVLVAPTTLLLHSASLPVEVRRLGRCSCLLDYCDCCGAVAVVEGRGGREKAGEERGGGGGGRGGRTPKHRWGRED